MKKIFLFLLCIILSLVTLGQEKKEFKDQIKGVRVTMPKFTGIERTIIEKSDFESLENYLKRNILPFIEPLEIIDEGTEVVQFVVNPSGELTDFKVINSVNPIYDEEVIRALLTTNGMWLPGLNNNQMVPMEKEVSIVFKLENASDFTSRAKRYYKKGGTMLYVKENPKKALKNFNQGVLLLPKEKCILMGRGLAKYELGDETGACQDWNRIKSLGGFEGDAYLENYCNMKGYAEMIKIMNE